MNNEKHNPSKIWWKKATFKNKLAKESINANYNVMGIVVLGILLIFGVGLVTTGIFKRVHRTNLQAVSSHVRIIKDHFNLKCQVLEENNTVIRLCTTVKQDCYVAIQKGNVHGIVCKSNYTKEWKQ